MPQRGDSQPSSRSAQELGNNVSERGAANAARVSLVPKNCVYGFRSQHTRRETFDTKRKGKAFTLVPTAQ